MNTGYHQGSACLLLGLAVLGLGCSTGDAFSAVAPDSDSGLSCGPGTVLFGAQCVVPDAGPDQGAFDSQGVDSTLADSPGEPPDSSPSDAQSDSSTADGAWDDAPWEAQTSEAGQPPVIVGQANPSCPNDTLCAETSCCESRLVPGGAFQMGRSAAGPDACPPGMACTGVDLPEHPASVPSYYLDTYEVTVGRFRAFVAAYPGNRPRAGDGAHPGLDDSGWLVGWDGYLPGTQDALKTSLLACAEYGTWSDVASGKETLPINCINYYLAFAFCAWDGGRLPTEAEWEAAASGGQQNRLYPWGSEAPSAELSVYGCLYSGGAECTASDIAPVGSRPQGAGLYGQKDLAGGMWEWVLDSYSDAWYSQGGNPCENCANLEPYAYHVVRGGSFRNQIEMLRASARSYGQAPYANYDIGFRCARDLAP